MKRTFAVIVIVCLVLLAAAFGLNGITHTNTQEEHIWLMQTLLPGAVDFEKVPYSGEDPIIRSVHQAPEGFVIETVTQGYAGQITMYIGVSNQGKVTGLVTLDAHETLGLGSRILTDHAFLAQFLNKSGNFTIMTPGPDAFTNATVKDKAVAEEIPIDGISGATVSSKAVARCVSAAVAYVTGADVVSSATKWEG